MKIPIAPDKFKGSLMASGVGIAINLACWLLNHNAEIFLYPMAYGGDTSVDILTDNFSLSIDEMDTLDPIGNDVLKNVNVHSLMKIRLSFKKGQKSSGLFILERSRSYNNLSA